MSRTFRFQAPPKLPKIITGVILRKRKRRGDPEFSLLATDGVLITDSNETYAIEEYRTYETFPPAVLTKKEADLIAVANPGRRPPIVLESIYPWLPSHKFIPDSKAGFNRLQKTVRRYRKHLVSAAAFCDEKWNTICNAVRRKNSLDINFYPAWHLPIQDTFVLEEIREDRCVVAIDFNAMYSACMQQRFPRPSSLQIAVWDRPLDSNDKLKLGLYRCILNDPSTEFIRRHNPFRNFCMGRYLAASLDEPVDVDLNEFELEYYRRHFKSIHIIHAIVSDEEIRHPLAKEAQRSFSRRNNYRKQGNKALADREKFLSTLLSSCSSRPSSSISLFQSHDQSLTFLASQYGILPSNDEPKTVIDDWLKRCGRISSFTDGETTTVKSPDLSDQSTCFLFSQRIVAKGRIMVLEKMEAICSRFPHALICYSNIDSIHFSVQKEMIDEVLNWLENDASNEMGSYKIEAVTDHGLWLEPGRYWLYSQHIEKFRNRGISTGKLALKDHAVYVISRKIEDLHIPIIVSVSLRNTMSATRYLAEGDHGITYQKLLETSNSTTFESVLDALEVNRKNAIPKRLLAFNRLKSLDTMHCPAASGQ